MWNLNRKNSWVYKFYHWISSALETGINYYLHWYIWIHMDIITIFNWCCQRRQYLYRFDFPMKTTTKGVAHFVEAWRHIHTTVPSVSFFSYQTIKSLFELLVASPKTGHWYFLFKTTSSYSSCQSQIFFVVVFFY